jgi:tRNA-dihydrouridine synthase 4
MARVTEFSTSHEERGSFWLKERRGMNYLAPLSDTSSPRSVTTDDDDIVNAQTPRRGRQGMRHIRGALIVQFAAHDTKTLADACELIHPHVDGIDLNLGTFPILTRRSCGWLLRTSTRTDRVSSKMGVPGEDWMLSSKAA